MKASYDKHLTRMKVYAGNPPSEPVNTGADGLSKATFFRHADKDPDTGERYLDMKTFVDAVAPPGEDYHKIKRNSYAVLFGVADRSRRGRVTLSDWLAFDRLLEQPDAEYQIAFRVFDSNATGSVNFKEFAKTYAGHRSCKIPFDWNSKWADLYLGESGKRHNLSYQQFTQMLCGLAGERGRQAFQYYDKGNTGFILPEEFEEMVKLVASHKLSDHLLVNLHTVVERPTSQSSKVSYATARAFFNLINRVEFVEFVATNAAGPDGIFTRQGFMNEAVRVLKFTTLTPLELDLLFHFANANGNPNTASLNKFQRMFDPQWQDELSRHKANTQRKASAARNAVSDPKSFFSEVFLNVYNFTLGSIAGAFGAAVVMPIDIVKTRLQNQRKTPPGTPALYRNSIDCFRKVLKHEGFRGLYAGLGPQLLGVAPEKAIKLTVNDLVRGTFTDSTGTVPLPAEILAGGSAGACQVVFTNPLEIVKIRLQIQGELARAEGIQRQSAIHIVRQLGLLGLYRGASACLLRDVPFSAIYFPTYAHLKRDYFKEGQRKLHAWQLLVSGAIAGIPAAYLTTPCDVIKTRLQVETRKGETSYKGLRHAAAVIWKEEGFKAFFKGGPARIFRSSPQFGCTLAAYEVLKRLFPYPGTSETEAGHAVPSTDSRDSPVKYLRSRNSLKVLLDIDENFGKPLSFATR